MSILNLGILAHIDAGKTSLTERLLHRAGAIEHVGSVDAGSTVTDSLALERQRGITIKSAVASFEIGDTTINLIDTPGHPDFIAEVERVLNVLDGAILVVSAVEGVQAQTRVLMRTLQRLRLPTMVFVNKIDRRGADPARVLAEITGKLLPTGTCSSGGMRATERSAGIAMGSVSKAGGPDAGFLPYDKKSGFDHLAETLAVLDDKFLAEYLRADGSVPDKRIRSELARQTAQAQVHPVHFGSAITGAGVDDLMDGVVSLLPPADCSADGPLEGTVFKVERGPAGEKVAYVRLFGGTIRIRDRVSFGHGELADFREAKVTRIQVFTRGTGVQQDVLLPGQIGKLSGLASVRIGDVILGSLAEEGPSLVGQAHHFAPPTLETVVAPVVSADKATLHLALTELAEQDPLIGLRQDDMRQETYVSLYGEVQKEVIQATLADEYGVDVTFEKTTTICIERVDGTGAALEVIKKDDNPYLATVGLRVEPRPVGSGVTFGLDVELGSMPFAFMKAVEETVHETLQQGLCGWRVEDCAVYLTHSGYWARQSHAHGTFDKSMSSTAGDFRMLTPLVLMTALREAGTTVLEPIHRFYLELPADSFGPILPVMGKLGAIPHTPHPDGTSYTLEGDIPAARVHELQQRLPGLTRGEGVLESAFHHYEPVHGIVPTRSRTDHNPLDRKEYLRHVKR